ncbi:uncharacterized protein LOC131649820 [Vicia villosa]|uniref:uncharacterized protein LOC131649820 n=1 Tax=Vicia villosa TaxID=3911 RepID=UPI00273CCA9D|nr:uncharacterized protein LOC131649820 [Vicia villosa]
MESYDCESKKVAALARRRRKQILSERRLKRSRVGDKELDFEVCFSRNYHPSIDNIRTPLSNITSSVINQRSHNLNAHPAELLRSSTTSRNVSVNKFQNQSQRNAYKLKSNTTTPKVGSCSSNSTCTMDTMSPNLVAATSYQRRKTIIQPNTPRLSRHHAFNSPVSLDANTPSSGTTSSFANQVFKDVDTHQSGLVVSSRRQLNVGVSSSTSNIHRNTSVNNEADETVEDGTTDESISDSDCEFINANPDYDTSSTLDDEETIEPNYTPQNVKDSDSITYQQYCRLYNIMFAFTSPEMKFDNRYQSAGGPPNIRIHGQTCHRIGSMLHLDEETPKFAQLYIYDTDNEIHHRMKGIGHNPNVNPETVEKLKLMLDEFNTHAKTFRMAEARLKDSHVPDLKLKLIANRSKDGRVYNPPTFSEVAALIVGDVDTGSKRHIILERQSGRLKRISEFHPSYLALQYPLLFPYGEDGFRIGILHRETKAKKNKNKLTIKEWLTFRIQTRPTEAHTLLMSRRLFQQFLVDGFTMMESHRLNYIRKHQKKLRVSKYKNLNGPEQDQNTQGANKGKRVVLPSTYVGSRRYMEQLYFYGMAICSHIGFPDLFITFTCNPMRPEVKRLLHTMRLQPHDRPDIISRVFKIKLDELLFDLTKKHVLGRVVACKLYY